MTTTDWIVNIALVLVVFRQLHEHRIDAKFVIIPLAMVGWAASSYLHTIPTAGNDLTLIVALAGAGAVLGVAGGVVTHVRTDGGTGFARAGFCSAFLWVAGMGARIGFYLYSEHGGADARTACNCSDRPARLWANTSCISRAIRPRSSAPAARA